MSYLAKQNKINVPYRRQGDNNSCVPTTIKMLVDYYIPGNPYSKKDIQYFCKTSKKGTKIEHAFNLLYNYAFEIKKLKKMKKPQTMINRICNYISTDTPIAIGYSTEGKYYDHMSIITGYDLDKSLFYLHDPYYGKNFKMPMGSLIVLTGEYYIIRPT